MSWVTTNRIVNSGLLNDNLTDTMQGDPNTSIVSNRIALDMTANGNSARMLVVDAGQPSIFTDGRISANSYNLSVSGSPTQELDLIAQTSGSVSGCLRMGTDKKLKFYDKNGNLLTSSTGTISTTTASPTEVVTFWDMAVSAPHVYIWLYLNGTEDIAGFNTGLGVASFADARFFGAVLPAGSNPGVTVTVDSYCSRYTTSVADAPYKTQYPRLKVVGGMSLPPTAEDTFNWTNSTTASPNTFQDVDDPGTNDGDTTRIWDSQTTDPKTAHDALYTYSAANPLPGGATVDYIQLKHTGKLLGASKNYASIKCKIAGTSVDSGGGNLGHTLVTSYQGLSYRFETNPNTSAAWASTDFDLSGGKSKLAFGAVSIVQAGVSTGPSITKIGGPEIVYHTALLPLATNPFATSPSRVFII